MTTARSTISFTGNNWEKLKSAKNRSKTVNLALSFYFESQKVLKKKEEEFILNEVAHYRDSEESYTFEETFK